MTNFLAQNLGNFTGIGPLGTVTSPTNATTRFANTISTILGFLTVLGGLWFMIQLITGAFTWISAGGDKQKLDSAKKKITNAIIGLFLVVVSFAVFAIITGFFGLDILNLGPAILNLGTSGTTNPVPPGNPYPTVPAI